jgi:putative glutamine amidotransferase
MSSETPDTKLAFDAATVPGRVAPGTQPEEGSTAVNAESRPLIGVSTSEMRASANVTPTPEGEPPQEEMALGMRYLRAIEQAGGIPVVIPPLSTAAIEPLLGKLAGLCLSGGPDVDPVAYSAARHAALGPSWRALDEFELGLVTAADARRLPILAICRGLQVLNVSRGGTLHQHLPEIVGGRITHRQLAPGATSTHWAAFTGQSRLQRILGGSRTKVNSFHHQAVETVGEGLVVTARASDGTVEGLEAADREFVLAVQWHAECLVDRPGQARLFAALVEAAVQFDEARSRFARVA